MRIVVRRKVCIKVTPGIRPSPPVVLYDESQLAENLFFTVLPNFKSVYLHQ